MILEVIKFGLFEGSFIAFIALGFALIYNILHLVDFAFTDRMVASSYMYIVMLNYTGTFYAIIITIIFAIILSIISELLIYRKIRKINPRLLILSSFGLSVTMQGILSIIFSDKTFEYPFIQKTILNTNIYFREFWILIALIIFCITLLVWIKKTKIGLLVRACVSNFEKSISSGINYKILYIIVFIISGIIAGISGIVFSMTDQLTPSAGFSILILAFSSCLIAGSNNIYGPVLIGLFIGVFKSLVEYKTTSLISLASTMLILLIIIVIKPNGIFGKKLRII